MLGMKTYPKDYIGHTIMSGRELEPERAGSAECTSGAPRPRTLAASRKQVTSAVLMNTPRRLTPGMVSRL
jgi:hypothetical protein